MEFKLLMVIFMSSGNYRQSDLYRLCGRDDYVANIEFIHDSWSYQKYGNNITVCIVYTPKERKQLENNIYALDNNYMVKAEILLHLDEEDKLIEKEGFDVRDIATISVLPNDRVNNRYYSSEKRKLNYINVSMNASPNGEDIHWIYGFYIKLKSNDIALSPEEEWAYLAYKFLLEKESLSDSENKVIGNTNGVVTNPNVLFYILLWKESKENLTESEEKSLSKIKAEKFQIRYKKMNEVLKEMGGFWGFAKKYPEKAALLLSKAWYFQETRFSNGKHLIYMDWDSLLHIYIRHVEELTTKHQYSERTKFQLLENDVLPVIEHILHAIDDEYQKFKDIFPDRKFSKYADQAYYLNGDYYAFRIDKDGRLETFYKLEGKT